MSTKSRQKSTNNYIPTCASFIYTARGFSALLPLITPCSLVVYEGIIKIKLCREMDIYFSST